MSDLSREAWLRRRVAVGLLAVLGTGGALCIVVGKRDPPLLARSRPVVRLRDEGAFDYAWRSSTRLIAFTQTGSDGRAGADFADVDITTGEWRALSRANPAFGKRLAKFEGFRVSPGGHWLLTGTPTGSAAWFLTLSLDRSAAISPKLQESWYPVSDSVWLRDGSGSVCLSSDGGGLFAVVRALQVPKATRGLSFGFPRGTSHFDLLPNHLLGQLPGGRILCLPGDAAPMAAQQGILPLVEFAPDRRNAAVSEVAISLPERPLLGELELSPRGDRLAWLVAEQPREPPILEWFLRLFPKSRGRRPSVVPVSIVLRISSVEGHSFRTIERIARFELRQQELIWNRVDARFPRRLRWMPDGKRVTFAYRNALWAVPVD